jgi:hypothetical protein
MALHSARYGPRSIELIYKQKLPPECTPAKDKLNMDDLSQAPGAIKSHKFIRGVSDNVKPKGS